MVINLKTSILILLCKILTKSMNILGKEGSVLPGSIIKKFDNDILEKLKYPKYVIGVTGSSGKGSTTSMIAHLLEDNNINVIWNKSGSNVVNGITTLALNNSSIFKHRVKAEVLLLELDESFIKHAFKKKIISHLVITNITRDQPARNGTPEIIFNKIKAVIDPKIHLIINSDDVLVNRLTITHDGLLTRYGIAKTKYSINQPLSDNLDGAYCPLCHVKLKYKYYHYGHLGDYKCPSCDYERKVDFEGTDLNLESSAMKINNYYINLNKNVFFAAYYSLAAFTTCKIIGLTDEQILKSFNINPLPSKRLKNLKFDKRNVEMLESKNENNLSYLQSINYINNYDQKKTIIIGFENVSRRYKYNDLSWLYDIDFKILNMENITRIFCIGRFRFDVALALVNSGIDQSKIIIVKDLQNIKILLKENSYGTIFTMACFDMTAVLNKLLRSIPNEN